MATKPSAMNLAAAWADDLASETEYVLTMAEAALPFEPDHPLMQRQGGGDTLLKQRLAEARRSGVFIDGRARRPVSLSAVLAAQRVVAHLHGLGYVSARQQSRWEQATAAAAAGGRSRNYLSVVLNDPARAFPRLDWALIGHAFGLPIPVWESPDPVYRAWLDRIAGGIAVFRRGLDFLDQFGGHGGLIRVRRQGARTPLTVVSNSRQIGAGGEPGMQQVKQGSRVSIQLGFPPAFQPPSGAATEALVLERDAQGHVSLITRAPLVADDLSCADGGEFPHTGSDMLPYLYFATPGQSTLYAVICSTPGLSALDCYQRTRRESLGQPALQPLLDDSDLAHLRRFLLSCDPSGWSLIRTRVEITG